MPLKDLLPTLNISQHPLDSRWPWNGQSWLCLELLQNSESPTCVLQSSQDQFDSEINFQDREDNSPGLPRLQPPGHHEPSLHCKTKVYKTIQQETVGLPVDLLVILRSWRVDARFNKVGFRDESSQLLPLCFKFVYLRLHNCGILDTSLFVTIMVLSSILVRQGNHMNVARFFVSRYPGTWHFRTGTMKKRSLLAVHLWTYVKHNANISVMGLLHHHHISFPGVTLHKAHRQVVCLRARRGEEADRERFRKRSHQALDTKVYTNAYFLSLTFTYFLRFSETNPWAVTSFPICCWPLQTTWNAVWKNCFWKQILPVDGSGQHVLSCCSSRGTPRCWTRTCTASPRTR